MKTLKNFGGLDKKFTEYRNAHIVILPIPFDKTSSWITGSDRGPDAILEASLHMELYDIETKSEVYRRGIHTAEPVNAATSHTMVKETKRRVAEFLEDQKLVVCLGGEHTVSLGSVQAHTKMYPKLSVLQLDAHTDMRQEYLGNPLNHACVMARIKEVTPNIVAVGIRSMDVSEQKNIIQENTFYAHQVHHSSSWIDRVVKRLSNEVYVTIDLDVFDPAYVPSTGTPEPGGLSWIQVTDLLRNVAKQRTIVGFDVVELCPSGQKASDFLAAKLIYTVLSYRFAGLA